MKIGHKALPHGGNGKLTGGTPRMRTHHKDGVSNDRTMKSVYFSASTIHLRYESQQEKNAKFIVNMYIGNS